MDDRRNNALLDAYKAGYQAGLVRISNGVDVAGSGDEYLRYIAMLRHHDEIIRQRAIGFAAAIKEAQWFLRSQEGAEA